MPPEAAPKPKFSIDPKKRFYPIVYVRGFAATAGEREDTFYDTYYGYATTAVEKRAARTDTAEREDHFFEPIVFEGQLIRFIKEYGYVDAANGGLALALSGRNAPRLDPTRSLWVSRFYDRDVLSERVRPIEEHAEELRRLICEVIPNELKALTDADGNKLVDWKDEDYKVILVAHSMGGLVCRCLIQNLLSQKGADPKRWIHRLVTIGTPHGGIELNAVPDFLEELATTTGNAFGSAIFKEPRMREYLKMTEKDVGNAPLPDLHGLNAKFPEGRCLCVIGSDYGSYGAARRATGSYSDGLVRQDRAFIKGAYWANVHRAHSGRRGIVNSFETYENVRRFLFGDVRVRLSLEGVKLTTAAPPDGVHEFFDVDFALSVKGTGVMLHQRVQDPCENGQRFRKGAGGELLLPDKSGTKVPSVHLHTGFLDSGLTTDPEGYSHFLMFFRVGLHQVRKGFVFDHEYPTRTVYSESLEVRVRLQDETRSREADRPAKVEFRWLSETNGWKEQLPTAPGEYRFRLRQADTLEGELCVRTRPWPDKTVDATNPDAAMD